MADEAGAGEVSEEDISKMPKEKSPSAFVIFISCELTELDSGRSSDESARIYVFT